MSTNIRMSAVEGGSLMPTPLHRYWLFAGDVYYACGGIHDLLATYPTLDVALTAAAAWEADADTNPLSWWHVIDQTTGQILAASAAQAYGATWPPDVPV
jgi:hypothetical protein